MTVDFQSSSSSKLPLAHGLGLRSHHCTLCRKTIKVVPVEDGLSTFPWAGLMSRMLTQAQATDPTPQANQ